MVIIKLRIDVIFLNYNSNKGDTDDWASEIYEDSEKDDDTSSGGFTSEEVLLAPGSAPPL